MELVSIQYLRAVAAISVVVFHLETQLHRMGFGGVFSESLAAGVDIFFIVSGFVMVLSTSHKEISPAEFYRRRFVRIVPLYWTLTTVMVAILLLKPELLQSARFDFWHVLSSYLFIPSLHPILGTMEPVLIPGWTLNYEMFFYVVFGATLLLPKSLRLVALLVGFLALVGVGSFISQKLTFYGFYTSNILIEFTFGVVIAKLYMSGWKVNFLAALLMIVVGLAALAASDMVALPRGCRWGIPAALIVLGTVGIESGGGLKSYRIPRFLGDASYSIYLAHGIALSAVAQFWKKLGFISLGPLTFSVFATVAACMAGCVVYVLLERPLLNVMRRRRSRYSRSDCLVG